LCPDFRLSKHGRAEFSTPFDFSPMDACRSARFSVLALFLTVQGFCKGQTWSSWNNGQSIGSFHGMAMSPAATVAAGKDFTGAYPGKGRIATRNHQTGEWAIVTTGDDGPFRDVVHANGKFVAVRDGGGIMTSPDGLAWTSRFSTTTRTLLSVIWDGGRFVVAGENGTILTSPDGVTWTWRNSGSTIHLTGLCFSVSRYVAVGTNGIRISNDAVTWATPSNAPSSIRFEACTWTGSCFLAGGRGDGGTPTLYASDDGSSWSLRNSDIKDNIASAVTRDGITYIAGAKSGPGHGFVKKSADNGVTWTEIYTPPNGTEYFTALAFDSGNLVVAGYNDNILATALSGIPSTVPPDLDIRVSEAKEVELRVRTREAMRYQPQVSTDLVSWDDLGDEIPGDGWTKIISDTVGTDPMRFYQLATTPVIVPEGELVILEARYGALGVSNDVKSQVEGVIQNGTVTITGFNANLGGDPIVGWFKALYVRYQNHTGVYEGAAPEGSTFKIPDANHKRIH
jgi:hypothetical protein